LLGNVIEPHSLTDLTSCFEVIPNGLAALASRYQEQQQANSNISKAIGNEKERINLLCCDINKHLHAVSCCFGTKFQQRNQLTKNPFL
jgi:hypothetical protein